MLVKNLKIEIIDKFQPKMYLFKKVKHFNFQYIEFECKN